MYQYIFTQNAEKEFKNLPQNIQTRVITKLKYFSSYSNPLIFASHLKNFEIGQYRFRIGDYRVIFDIENKKIIILTLGHRREIYK